MDLIQLKRTATDKWINNRHKWHIEEVHKSVCSKGKTEDQLASDLRTKCQPENPTIREEKLVEWNEEGLAPDGLN